MNPHSVVFLASLVPAIVLLILVDRLLRPGLRRLLEDVTALPAAAEFYLRAFALAIVLIALAAVFGTHPDLKGDVHFMEYVWAVAAVLQYVFQNLLVVLLVYVALITVLMASLRRKQ